MLTCCSSDPRRGYAFGATTPEGVRTVAVPIFANQTLHTGVEAELTEAIIKQVQATTPVRVVQLGEHADTTLTGAITDVRMHRLSLASQTGLVQELALTLTIDFEWRDNRTGEVLAARRGFSTSESFIPSRPTGEPLERGMHGAVQRTARDVATFMGSSW
jgi:hypothetical protein